MWTIRNTNGEKGDSLKYNLLACAITHTHTHTEHMLTSTVLNWSNFWGHTSYNTVSLPVPLFAEKYLL